MSQNKCYSKLSSSLVWHLTLTTSSWIPGKILQTIKILIFTEIEVANKEHKTNLYVTQPQGRLTDVKLGQEIHKEHDFHSLHCVHNSMFKVIDRLLTLSHILYWNKREIHKWMFLSTMQTLPFEGHNVAYQCKGLDQSNIVCEYEVNLSTNEMVITEIQNFNTKW